MRKILYVTGTDTHVGKTYIAVGLLKLLNQKGYKTIGLKPIATGDRLFNDDALQLKKNSSISVNYDEVNPFLFPDPCSPNIAAKLSDLQLCATNVARKIKRVLDKRPDCLVIEGAGGWSVPINNDETLADVVKLMKPAVLVVVNVKLGCINHALLTIRSILEQGFNCIGWIANCTEPSIAYFDQQLHTLMNWIPAECLGVVKYRVAPENSLSIENWLCAQ